MDANTKRIIEYGCTAARINKAFEFDLFLFSQLFAVSRQTGPAFYINFLRSNLLMFIKKLSLFIFLSTYEKTIPSPRVGLSQAHQPTF